MESRNSCRNRKQAEAQRVQKNFSKKKADFRLQILLALGTTRNEEKFGQNLSHAGPAAKHVLIRNLRPGSSKKYKHRDFASSGTTKTAPESSCGIHEAPAPEKPIKGQAILTECH